MSIVSTSMDSRIIAVQFNYIYAVCVYKYVCSRERERESLTSDAITEFEHIE